MELPIITILDVRQDELSLWSKSGVRAALGKLGDHNSVDAINGFHDIYFDVVGFLKTAKLTSW
jgi:hypothetical protein